MFAACSTPAGISGIAVIRVSGDGCGEAVDKIARVIRAADNCKTIADLKGYTAAYCVIEDPVTKEKIDDVVITKFENPHSYTGEEMVEISCHGSLAVKQEILRLLGECGIEPAGPGEFSKTAFINGKMSLDRVEAVMDVIASDSQKALSAAENIMSGALSDLLNKAESEIYRAMALIEMTVEFPEHDDTPENEEEITDICVTQRDSLKDLTTRFEQGRILSERMRVALLGLPNSGKSSLLNALSGYERAIVTEVPGTTRDTVEVDLSVGGIPVTLIDTAGLRQSDDKVEAEGIRRASDTFKAADMAFYLVSPEMQPEEVKTQLDDLGKDTYTVVLFSKADAGENPQRDRIQKICEEHGIEKFISVSGTENINLDSIRNSIEERYERAGSGSTEGLIVTNARHRECIAQAVKYMDAATDAARGQLGLELVSSALRAAADEIGKITGKTVSSELADTIFSRFCIGK